MALVTGITTAAVAQSGQFSDVPADHESATAIAWAVENQITLGYGDDTFKPDIGLPKNHAVTFIERYYDDVLGADTSPEFTRADMMTLLHTISGAPTTTADADNSTSNTLCHDKAYLDALKAQDNPAATIVYWHYVDQVTHINIAEIAIAYFNSPTRQNADAYDRAYTVWLTEFSGGNVHPQFAAHRDLLTFYDGDFEALSDLKTAEFDVEVLFEHHYAQGIAHEDAASFAISLLYGAFTDSSDISVPYADAVSTTYEQRLRARHDNLTSRFPVFQAAHDGANQAALKACG